MGESSRFAYGLVARSGTILAEVSLVQGNAKAIAQRILENLNPANKNVVVEQGDRTFRAVTDDDGLTYMVLTSKEVQAATVWQFLNEVRQKWVGKYGGRSASFAPGSKNQEFGEVELRGLLRNYNSGTFQKISQIQQNLSETQEKMAQNLSAALARGEQLSVMEETAGRIKDQSTQFRREATKVNRMMCWQKWRFYILGTVVVLVVVFIIIWICCGASFSKCRKGGKQK